MLTALYIMLGLALMLGGLLGLSALLFKVERKPLVTRLDAILPQTQCRQCGYPGCKPYAIAIANGEADINQCPPGGDTGARALADLMGMEYKPLNPEYGLQKPKSVALIDEVTCIGCTLCIQACPVDAILGAAKHMHTIIAAECTGCELCLAPCPVDCITMVPVAETPDNWKWKYPVFPIKSGIPLVQYYRYAKSEIFSVDKAQEAADIARKRHDFRLARIEKEKLERAQKHAERALANKAEVKEKADAALDKPQSEDAINKKATHQIDKKAAIAAAIARVKAQKLAAAEVGILPKNTENLSASIQSEIDDIEAMRGKANHMTEG